MTMKAIVCERAGEDGFASYRDYPIPAPGPKEIVVEARAMSVNFPDVLQIGGLYQRKPSVPFVLGMEFAGIVTEVGGEVRSFRVGDRVAGMTQGAFAQYVRAPEDTCYPLPDGIDFETGAVVPLAAGTAAYGLRARGGLRAGETLAVLGASGGTGLYAVQIGRALGARTIAICSTEAKAAIAREAGAAETIISGNEDVGDRLRELTGGRGVDVVYDPVGGDLFDQVCRRLAWNGRLLTVGFAAGRIPHLPVNLPLIKGYSLVGVQWSVAIEQEVELARGLVADLFEMVGKGEIRPVIGTRYPLAEGVDAIGQMRDRKAVGKILLLA